MTTEQRRLAIAAFVVGVVVVLLVINTLFNVVTIDQFLD